MNGELFQIASIVAASKKAIQSSAAINYNMPKYENSIRFAFLPKKRFFIKKKYIAPDVSAWFNQIKKDGVQDIKLLCPLSTDNRELLGFSNSSKNVILCFYNNRKVTYFVPNWQFDNNENKWNILYSEYKWTNPPATKPKFENNTDSFRKILLSIKDFALKIECENFAQVFDSAINLLDGCNDYQDQKYCLELPQIPQKNLNLFEAAGIADVFGAMGSWNDTPSCMAQEKGLEKEYNELSDELLKNVRLAVLYAINEW